MHIVNPSSNFNAVSVGLYSFGLSIAVDFFFSGHATDKCLINQRNKDADFRPGILTAVYVQ